MEKKQAEMAAAQSEKEQLLASSKAEASGCHHNGLKQVGLASHLYAGDHGNLLPTNIGQIRGLLFQRGF